MRADLLHVILPYSNPLRWKSRERLARDCITHLMGAGVQVYVVECAYGDTPYVFEDIEGIVHIPVYAQTPYWNKESLINIGIHRAPRDAKYFMWCDADIKFRKSGWAAEVVHALQHFPIIQPWAEVYDLGPNDEHLHVWKSFCKMQVDRPHMIGHSGKAGYEFAHPGYCWAATRTFLESVGGLIDFAPLGAADHHMALAMVGKGELSLPGNIHINYKEMVLRWGERAKQAVTQGIGYLAQTIEHAWHGPKEQRKYIDRWQIVTGNKYDPIADTKRNTAGVLEYSGSKPKMLSEHWAYLRNRNEDSNAI